MTFPFSSHYLPPQNSGPCNSFHCLGHFKNVYDDDDDDDDEHSEERDPMVCTVTYIRLTSIRLRRICGSA